MRRSLPFLGVTCLLAISAAEAIELKARGHFAKSYVSVFRNSEYFDDDGHRHAFEADGHGRFSQASLEYRYGWSERLNAGVSGRFVSITFDNDFGLQREQALGDLEGVVEYRTLYMPNILSFRASLSGPLAGGEKRALWVGNHTIDASFGVNFKRLFSGTDFTWSWLDLDIALRKALRDDERNIDGAWALPWRAAASIRPNLHVTLTLGLVGSHNERRDYVGVDGQLKYRFGWSPFEIEAGFTRIFRGRNGSAGNAVLLGCTVNTRRLWE